MQDGLIANGPIWDDVRTLAGSCFVDETIDIISGGFPCQDISVAGMRRGLEAERSGLFFEVMRLAEEVRPHFIFLENVPGIRGYLSLVAQAMANAGYDCRWDIVSAQEIGAPHIRKRWFALAHSASKRSSAKREKATRSHIKPSRIIMDNAMRRRQGSSEKQIRTGRDSTFDASWWDVEPDVDRMVNGLPFRVDRIKGLGNAVVPLQAREAFERLCGLK